MTVAPTPAVPVTGAFCFERTDEVAGPHSEYDFWKSGHRHGHGRDDAEAGLAGTSCGGALPERVPTEGSCARRLLTLSQTGWGMFVDDRGAREADRVGDGGHL